MITTGRHPEGLLERTREMIGAQPCHFGELRQGDLIGEVLLDILGDDPPLPAGETTLQCWCGRRPATVELQQLVCEDDTQRFGITSASRWAGLDQCCELQRRLPQGMTVKEEPRRELRGGEASHRIHQRSARIDVEVCGLHRPARVVPLPKPAARRHEGQLAAEVTQRRSRQIFESAVALLPRGALIGDQQVRRSAIIAPEGFLLAYPDNLPAQTTPCGGLTSG